MDFSFWVDALDLSVRAHQISTNPRLPARLFRIHHLTNSLVLEIGHYLDQRRLKQGLYRHPWDDISYVLPEKFAE